MRTNTATKMYSKKRFKSETYHEDGMFITKNYYDNPENNVKERIIINDGNKEINSFTAAGVLAKSENFKGDIRHGAEIKYFIPKANKSIKSKKFYVDGKLHGEGITYNMNDDIIKQEVFAVGKVVFNYVRDDAFEIVGINVIDEAGIKNLSPSDAEVLKAFKNDKPEWFK